MATTTDGKNQNVNKCKRTIRVRAGHRSSLKKNLSKAEQALSRSITDLHPTEINEHKVLITQLRAALLEKLTIIQELDHEILECTEDEDIEGEIEQSDNLKDTITLMSLRLDSALENLSPKPKFNPVPDNHTYQYQASVSTEQESSPGINIDTPQGLDSSIVNPTVSPTRNPISSDVLARPHVKLPKLDLRKFNGDHSKWQSFWDTFTTSIHENSNQSDIDKFNYLNSLLDGVAAGSIAGLALTAPNYQEAITILQKRFGNRQQIVNRHMNILLNTHTVTDMHNLRGIRQLYDTVEANVRSLRSLGIPSTTYGSLLSSIIINKLPTELRLIVSRAIEDQDWNLDKMLLIIEKEVEARERTTNYPPSNVTANTSRSNGLYRRFPNNNNNQSTAAALLTGGQWSPTCTYCSGQHPSNSCKIVSSLQSRKEILQKHKRCFICLRKDHISRECTPGRVCQKCHSRHHISICPHLHGDFKPESLHVNPQEHRPRSLETPTINSPKDTSMTKSYSHSSVMYTNTSMDTVLLQTARAHIFNPTSTVHSTNCRVIFGTGSPRSYVTTQLRDFLQLPTISRTSVTINTFGSTLEIPQETDVVRIFIGTTSGRRIQITAFVVPVICQLIKYQDVVEVKSRYPHLHNLQLADYPEPRSNGTIHILIGLDHYWDFITGRVKRGEQGPVGIETSLGWILSGPSFGTDTPTDHILITTLQVGLNEQLRQFWDLEAIGLKPSSIYEELTETITFTKGRYEVKLPWKNPHPTLPDNYQLCLRRLYGCFQRLKGNPALLQDYDKIIQEQRNQKIVELVESPGTSNLGTIHYLPHHPVIRSDKSTTKIRIVYDASAKTESNPSLNECLYTGPSMNQKIFDVILRFRSHKIALTGDIEKAFLMITLPEADRDVLRFLWYGDINKDVPDLITLRFTRVVFGVSSSPFLLNATIKYHMEKYNDLYPEFVRRFMRSIYVDDLTSGANSEGEAFELYQLSKSCLSEGGFNMRKFKTNSTTLQDRINGIETNDHNNQPTNTTIQEDDQTFVKSTLGNHPKSVLEEYSTQRILGVEWNYITDELIFNLQDIAKSSQTTVPTKRNIVSITAKFFDPLGFISPFIIQFKVLFQELCKAKIDWDEPISDNLLTKWNHLVTSMSNTNTVTLPRFYQASIDEVPTNITLVGFCDASTQAYAAVIYLRIQTESGVYVRFVASKTRVAPTNPTTIPRLELLSALILSRLIVSVQKSLEFEVSINQILCFTDSRVTLYWILNQTKEWKQWVQNRVNEIRTLTSTCIWSHTPGCDNPADLPSRGVDLSELCHSQLWKEGPPWLKTDRSFPNSQELDDEPLKECVTEMKVSSREILASTTLLTDQQNSHSISIVIDSTKYSSFIKLIRISALVYKLIHILKYKKQIDPNMAMVRAEVEWLKDVQNDLKSHRNYDSWTKQFGIFTGEDGILRCTGRISKADVPNSTKCPILLNKDHHLTELIVYQCHERVSHEGVKSTLTELRSNYWLIKGRQYVRKILHKCITCRRFDGKPFKSMVSPPLPEFRVQQSPVFSSIGLDFAGPLFTKGTGSETSTNKAWICLFLCCASRAVHLELVPDLTTASFIRCFRRFTARRGIPQRVISDNAKTFIAASNDLKNLLDSQEVSTYFHSKHIQWMFNLEKAPWSLGLFERLIQSMKRCLKRILGKSKLSFEELCTVLSEVEATLNSRPLTYVSTEEFEEPLTPSHLVVGRRILNLPDVQQDDIADPEYHASHDDLTKRMTHLSVILQHFWNRWSTEYLLELRSTHNQNGETNQTIGIGQIVIVSNEHLPRGQWRLGKVIDLLPGHDDIVRGAVVRTTTSSGKLTTINRPLRLLYPLEINSPDNNLDTPANQGYSVAQTDHERIREEQPPTDDTSNIRPRRKAAVKSDEKRQLWLKDLH